MEKAIKLKMCNDKSIKIFLNDQEKYTIDMQNRSIDAAKLYEIIAFDPGDKYVVLTENEDNVDVQVLEFFTELFANIANRVDAIEPNGKASNNVATD